MTRAQAKRFRAALVRGEGRWWIAEVPAMGICSQGTSKRAALRNLASAVQEMLLFNWEEQFGIQRMRRGRPKRACAGDLKEI